MSIIKTQYGRNISSWDLFIFFSMIKWNSILLFKNILNIEHSSKNFLQTAWLQTMEHSDASTNSLSLNILIFRIWRKYLWMILLIMLKYYQTQHSIDENIEQRLVVWLIIQYATIKGESEHSSAGAITTNSWNKISQDCKQRKSKNKKAFQFWLMKKWNNFLKLQKLKKENSLLWEMSFCSALLTLHD